MSLDPDVRKRVEAATAATGCWTHDAQKILKALDEAEERCRAAEEKRQGFQTAMDEAMTRLADAQRAVGFTEVVGSGVGDAANRLAAYCQGIAADRDFLADLAGKAIVLAGLEYGVEPVEVFPHALTASVNALRVKRDALQAALDRQDPHKGEGIP